MKWTHKVSLGMIAGLAIILPMSGFAEDQKQDDKKQGKKQAGGHQQKGKVTPQGLTRVATPSSERSDEKHLHNEGRVNSASNGQGHVSHVLKGSATSRRFNVSPVTSQRSEPASRLERTQRNQVSSNRMAYKKSDRSGGISVTSQRLQSSNRLERTQRNQTQVFSNQQYNRSNNYGGLWFAENTHRDWNRNGQHYWNHHQYRWYEGGWLIIDGGFSPSYSDRGYSNRGSTARSVQSRLADQGYYQGPIDGDIGPGSRNAIADYQSDHDLRVTGRINDPLLESLRLE